LNGIRHTTAGLLQDNWTDLHVTSEMDGNLCKFFKEAPFKLECDLVGCVELPILPIQTHSPVPVHRCHVPRDGPECSLATGLSKSNMILCA
jgi:hypothetical protein